jgi:broad specificity phosphatase PhoE
MLTTREAFSEFDMGEWAGKPFDELHGDARWGTFNAKRGDRDIRAPGGESMHEVQVRAVSALKELASDYGPHDLLAVVTHADVIRAALLWVACGDLAHFNRFAIDPCSITELEVNGDHWRILRLNDCAHLENPRRESR